MSESLTISASSSPAWNLGWLTPSRCRWLLAAILAAGFLLHLRYLTHDCPVDLSEDEAYYWDWSRKLDLSYYSKGPLVAVVIRASCRVLGDTMLGVRFPALLLAVGTSLVTYWTAKRLFDSDRVALGAVLLNHTVPMFIVGSVLMTIDPLAYFFWGLASLFLVEAVFYEKRWAWIGIGLALGLGFLAKFAVFLWLPGAMVFLLADKRARKWLATPWPWVMMLIAVALTSPILIWNWQHGWTNAHHVARDTGTDSGGKFEIGNLVEFVGGQLGAMGPALWVIFIGAVVAVWRSTERRREQILLVCLAVPYFAMVSLGVLRAKVQVNWPVYAYFGWIILAAWFLSTRLRDKATWRSWRPWFWPTVAIAIIFSPIAHNTEMLYGPMSRLGAMLRKPDATPKPSGKRRGIAETLSQPRRWDPTYRLRGWAELGQVVSKRLETLRPGAFIMGERYQFTAELAFYVKGQPKTYCVGSWFENTKRRARRSQYDIWTDRGMDRPELIGKDAVFMGDDPDDPEHPAYDLMAAFETFERLPTVEIYRRGVKVREFKLWVGRGFKGMKNPGGLEKN